MILDLSRSGLCAEFEFTADGIAALRHLSHSGEGRGRPKKLAYCTVADLQLSGENTFDIHFAKHTGSWGSRQLKYVSHVRRKNAIGEALEILLTDGRLELTAHYRFYDGISAVRAWTTVKNVSDETVGLEYVSSFCYTGFDDGEDSPNEKLRVLLPHNAWCRESIWREYGLSELGFERSDNVSGKRIALSNTGTWSSKEHLPMGAVQNLATNDTYLWQIESNGSWQWELADVSDMMYFKLSGPTEQENGWHRELRPGETFESVAACVAVGGDLDGAVAAMTAYRRTIAARNEADGHLPVIFNDYLHCLSADPTEERCREQIDAAVRAGAEYYVMDAGWYATGYWWDSVGEWQPEPSRFPNGIRAVFDYARERGLTPGIWLEPESMGVRCPLAAQWSDDHFFVRHGRRVVDRGRYFLDFRHPQVRAHLDRVVDRAVREWGIGYFKFDYNVEGGCGTELAADSFGDGLLQHTRAVLSWIDGIAARYPDVILENCSSGGLRTDYAMLSHMHLASASDQESCIETAHIAAAIGMAVLPEQVAVWSYPLASDPERLVVWNMVNAMLTRIHLSGETAKLDEPSLSLVREGVACYKSYRADIAEGLPFYPLGLPKHTDGWHCAAYRYPRAGRVRLAVWRFASGEDAVTIPLDGVEDLHVLYPSSSACHCEKNEIGYTVSLPEPFSAVLLEGTTNT